MVQLILIVISIALVAALGLATVNYVPWHIRPAAYIAATTQDGLLKVAAAYQVAVSLNGGVSPEVTGSPEDAFQAVFVTNLLKLNPGAPAGYTWRYGLFVDSAHPGSRYDGLHYVCVAPSIPAQTSDLALERGLSQARSIFSKEQVTISEVCGSKNSQTDFTVAPVLTMFLVPAPEFTP